MPLVMSPLRPHLGLRFAIGLAIALGAFVNVAAAGELTVLSIQPAMNARNVSVNAPIRVNFNTPVMRSSVTSHNFWAFARWSGTAAGKIDFTNGDQTVTLTPDHAFSHGESVMVVLGHDLLGIDGSPLRAVGYSWQFTTRVRPTPMVFTPITTLSTHPNPKQDVRSYGGIASDLNHDGWLDLTIVNEVSADLRVFIHNTSVQTPYTTFVQPTFPVGNRASPSEPSDFNRDGHTDIAVVNANANSVSILLGNGNGGYGPQQVVTVGGAPRGNAVLDADGDGDIDIVNTNSQGAGNLTLLVNNGLGVFSATTPFEGGGTGEWALTAAEMNNDGILDLVVGAFSSEQITVARGNGNGSFTPLVSQSAGGWVWTIMCGDLNGDNNIDVTSANSTDNNAAILLGNGAGGLSAPQVIATDPFVIGTDIGDLDGDGDLDWVLSSFSGDWSLRRNNGNGTFTLVQEFTPPQAASCALPFDCDNDGDLDLGLIDEIADVVVLRRNSGIARPGDVIGNGVVNVDDLLGVITNWGPCAAYQPCAADVAPAPNGDDTVNVNDLLMVITNWG